MVDALTAGIEAYRSASDHTVCPDLLAAIKAIHVDKADTELFKEITIEFTDVSESMPSKVTFVPVPKPAAGGAGAGGLGR